MKQHGDIICLQRSMLNTYAKVSLKVIANILSCFRGLYAILALISCITAQKDKGCYRPEKTLLFRITRLQALGIELVFVFDGPERPELKRNQKSSQVPWKEIYLWRQILDRLQVPYHQAPGEAEAECARLQSLGIVDAVWSEDSDCFMFGCRLLIRTRQELNPRNQKEPKTPSTTHVRIYSSKSIYDKHGLDRDGFALFALLCGGDYDTTGLRGCGPQLAQEAVRHGLDKKLCAEGYHKSRFRAQLITFLREKGVNLVLDKDFPSDSVRKAYLHPKVSSDQRLKELVADMMNPTNQDLVESFLLPYFNFWAVEYIKHIAPILLLKELTQSSPDQEIHLTQRFDIRLIKQRKKTSTAKISFLPAKLCPIDKIPTKTGHIMPSETRAELETLRCVLEQCIPSLFSPGRQTTSAIKRDEERKSNEDAGVRYLENPPNSTVKRGPKRKSTADSASALSEPPMKNYSSVRSLDFLHSTTAGALSTPRSAGFSIPIMQDFGAPIGYNNTSSNNESPAPDTSEDDDLQRAIALSLLDQEPRSAKRPTTATNAPPIGRDTTHTTFDSFDRVLGMDRRQMEQERLGRLHQQVNAGMSPFRGTLTSLSSNTDTPARGPQPRAMDTVVIDLTDD